MSEVITVQDLENLKKHEIFEAEVITGKVGGLASGANINSATNAVTGQIQDTLPKILSDLGMQVQSWPASVGGVLTSPSQMFLNDIVGSAGKDDYYAWAGAFPKTVAPGTDPALAGSGYVKRSDKFAKVAAREAIRRSYAEAGYTLTPGSFEAGGVLTSARDVLLHEASGKAYTGAGPFPQTVPAGTDPTSVGFTFIDIGQSTVPDYTTLRAYAGPAKTVFVSGVVGVSAPYSIAGAFAHDATDTTSADNGGTVIVDGLNRRWKRQYDGLANVLWWGVKADGATNDTAAMQSALDSGLAEYFCPRGIYLFNGSISVPQWARIVGENFIEATGNPTASTNSTVFKSTLTSGDFLTGALITVERVTFFNGVFVYGTTSTGSTATAVGLSSGTFKSCVFISWYAVFNMTGTPYYTLIENCNMRFCDYGFIFQVAAYNLNLVRPSFTDVKKVFYGVGNQGWSDIKVMGGSIENYQEVSNGPGHLAFFGTYFESLTPVNAAIQFTTDDASVGLFGCKIYVNNHSYFIHNSGRNYLSITSIGNSLVGDSVVPGASYCALPVQGNVVMKSDKLSGAYSGNYTDVTADSSDGIGFDIDYPNIPGTSLQAAWSLKKWRGPTTARQTTYQPVAAYPASPAKGTVVYHNPTNKLSVFDGSVWVPLH